MNWSQLKINMEANKCSFSPLNWLRNVISSLNFIWYSEFILPPSLCLQECKLSPRVKVFISSSVAWPCGSYATDPDEVASQLSWILYSHLSFMGCYCTSMLALQWVLHSFLFLSLVQKLTVEPRIQRHQYFKSRGSLGGNIFCGEKLMKMLWV